MVVQTVEAESALKASVIVPAHNASKSIGDCLVALENQTIPREMYEIIVVDDQSTDGTAKVVEGHGVKVLRQPKQGPAAARNLGVEEAKGPIVAFVDADCVPERGWLEALLQPFHNQEVVGAKGAYRSSQREVVARFVQLEYEEKYDRMRREEYIDFVDTYSAAYRRDVFLQNGGFDATFPSASVEDQEFSFRLAGRGYKMVFQPQAIVFHQHANSVRHYFKKKFRIGYWKTYVHRRHPDKLMRDSHTPEALKLQTFLAPVILGASLTGLFSRKALLVPLAASGLFGLSTLPFVIKSVKTDPFVAVSSPFLLMVRAVGLGSGLLVGLLRSPGRSTTGRSFD